MERDLRADIEQTLTQGYHRKPTRAELDKATEFMSLYLQAGKGTQELIADVLEVTAKLHAQGKDAEALEYIHQKTREVEGK